MQTLRGSGPAPAGYYRCCDAKCPARREPCSGRFAKSGGHYHPTTIAERVPAGQLCRFGMWHPDGLCECFATRE